MSMTGLRDLVHGRPALLPLLIFFVSLGINLIGVRWGLPNERHSWSYHPDEPIVWAAAQDAPLPGFYNYGTLYLDLVRIATIVSAASTPDLQPSEAASSVNVISLSHLYSRFISAVAGAAACMLVYLLLSCRAGMIAATLAALALVFAPGLTVHSRFATVDVFATCLVTLALWLAVRIAWTDSGGREPSGVLWAGAVAGLAAGTKLNAGFVILAVLAAIWLAASHEAKLLSGIKAVGSFLLAFLIATPGAVLDSKKFRSDVLSEIVHVRQGHGLLFIDSAPGGIYHLANFSAGIGALTTALGVIGIALACWKGKKWALVLMAFALPYYTVISLSEVKFLRYALPVFPVVAVGFGWLISAAHRRGGVGRFAVAVAILGLGGETSLAGLRGTLTYSMWMSGRDPRDEAADWILSRVSAARPDVGLGSDPWFYTAPVFPEAGMPRSVWMSNGRSILESTSSPRVVLVEGDERPSFITVSSLEFGPAWKLSAKPSIPEAARGEVERWRRLERILQADYTLAAVFGGGGPTVHDLEYVRPSVAVYERKGVEP